jgi:hypothetical protein
MFWAAAWVDGGKIIAAQTSDAPIAALALRIDGAAVMQSAFTGPLVMASDFMALARIGRDGGLECDGRRRADGKPIA